MTIQRSDLQHDPLPLRDLAFRVIYDAFHQAPVRVLIGNTVSKLHVHEIWLVVTAVDGVDLKEPLHVLFELYEYELDDVRDVAKATAAVAEVQEQIAAVRARRKLANLKGPPP